MTLVLSTATQAYALQVSDRLVSTSPRLEEYDPLANKTIVLRASDALVVLGYSGVAFIGEKPTDHWLAEQILGHPFEVHGFAAGPGWMPDLGQIILRIVEGYGALSALTRRYGLQISMTGFQISRKGRWRQVVWRLRPTPDGVRLRAGQGVPRHFPARNVRATGFVPDGGLSRERYREMIKRLLDTGIAGFDNAERVLVETIRDVALPGSGVGPHCMAVAIAPWSLDHVRVRYSPLADPGVSPGTVAYGPWIVGPGLLTPPAEMLGGWTCQSDALKVELEAPPVPAGAKVFASLKTQKRKPPPGRRAPG